MWSIITGMSFEYNMLLVVAASNLGQPSQRS